MSDDGNQDLDQQVRNNAARAAQQRAEQLAAQLAIRHAESEYDEARQRAANNVPTQPRRQGRTHRFGPPPARPRINDAAEDFVPPPPPRFATDTAAALTAATQAMAAIADSLGRSGSNSRGRGFLRGFFSRFLESPAFC